jgi:hypothetical protein
MSACRGAVAKGEEVGEVMMLGGGVAPSDGDAYGRHGSKERVPGNNESRSDGDRE